MRKAPSFIYLFPQQLAGTQGLLSSVPRQRGGSSTQGALLEDGVKMYMPVCSHAHVTLRQCGSCIELDVLPTLRAPGPAWGCQGWRGRGRSISPAPTHPLPAAQGDAHLGSCLPSGSHSPVNTEGMGRGGKIMVHGINLGVVCIFIALASDSSLQKGFKKD